MRQGARLPIAAALLTGAIAAQDWQPVPGHLQTQWASSVSPHLCWPEHPRPLLRRTNWRSQNGLWDYAITAADAAMPAAADGAILVPFPIESALSGVGRALRPDQRLWYRRQLALPERPAERLLLHFDAVDHACEVFVDGTKVGEHRGGFDPFTFEITRALARGREHTVLVGVRDPGDAGAQPRGKQVLQPGGIWYTSCSGIWQTVWLEGVPATFLADLDVDADRQDGKVHIRVEVDGDPAGQVCMARIFDRAQIVAEVRAPLGQPLDCTLPAPRAWSPRDPFRYGLQLRTFGAGDDATEQNDGDWVNSYFALRDVGIGPDQRGTLRIRINGAPTLLFGPLDQGYWPDGLFTPPTFPAMCADLDVIQRFGCNMLRKHGKVECERFYEECDKRGLLVLQDMPSGSCQDDPATFERELRALIHARRRHPSIVLWVVFNEGWGQHDTERLVALVRELDPTRLVDNASGWTDRACGDVLDAHVYPGPAMPAVAPGRAAVLGEFGGLGLPVPDHTWTKAHNWGYVQFADARALTDAYVARLAALRPLIAEGLCAAVYTQTTDVENECNGWLTYDRAVTKVDPERAAFAARALQAPAGELLPLAATARTATVLWHYTTTEPTVNWQRPEFDDASWATGPGGFGTDGTPGAHVGTPWTTPSIWLRRTIELPTAEQHELLWSVHHDEDLEVYLDGEPALELTGFTTGYEYLPVAAAVRDRLRPGKHLLAVRCRQTTGGQFVDVGLFDLKTH